MGLFDTVIVDDGIELPAFPRDRSPTDITWQTKDIGRPSMRTFKLSAAGRLLRRAREMREKTEAEKQAEADEQGFDSWEEYVAYCDEANPTELLDRGIRPVGPGHQTVAEEFWLDHTMHGTVEFHGSSDEIEDGFYWSYEARFAKGDLDAIVFLGERGGDSAEAVDRPGSDVVRF